jgi:peptidyl-prolyl cis-trans isomerase B (cyclophilin B)
LREKTVAAFPRAKIEAISVQDDKSSVDLKKEGKDWKVSWTKGELSGGGPAKKETIQLILDRIADIQASQFLDGWSNQRAGLDKPSRVVTVTSNIEGPDSAKTVFFGRALDKDQVAVRAEGMDAAAGVIFPLEATFPKDPYAYLETPPTAEGLAASKSPSSESAPAAVKKGSKVKLEPTVDSPKDIKKLPAPIVKKAHKYTAHMKLGSGKELEIEFFSDTAPYTASNFIHLARNHFYDGLKFHRVIADFVIQGGDPTGTGAGGPGYKFDNEDNAEKHLRGSLSMAHAGRNTNGSQFFIVLAPQPHLDGLHTVFGKVTKGTEILDSVRKDEIMKTVEVFEEAL